MADDSTGDYGNGNDAAARERGRKHLAEARKRDSGYWKERERIAQVNDKKTERLRALRLEKEAADLATASAKAAP